MMTNLNDTRAVLGIAARIAVEERAPAVEVAHVLGALGHCDAPEIRELVERFPGLRTPGPAPPRHALLRRLRSRPRPSAPVRAAAERAFADAARVGRAP